MTKQTLHMKASVHKEELEQRNRHGKVSRKTARVLNAQNPTLSSDAAPNYQKKNYFGPHRSPPPHLLNTTVKQNIINAVMRNKLKGSMAI